jgi:hypothetical protein
LNQFKLILMPRWSIIRLAKWSTFRLTKTVAKEINDREYGALCHAISHAEATVHVETHALGLPIYELTAILLKYGKDNFSKPVSEKINHY